MSWFCFRFLFVLHFEILKYINMSRSAISILMAQIRASYLLSSRLTYLVACLTYPLGYFSDHKPEIWEPFSPYFTQPHVQSIRKSCQFYFQNILCIHKPLSMSRGTSSVSASISCLYCWSNIFTNSLPPLSVSSNSRPFST